MALLVNGLENCSKYFKAVAFSQEYVAVEKNKACQMLAAHDRRIGTSISQNVVFVLSMIQFIDAATIDRMIDVVPLKVRSCSTI